MKRRGTRAAMRDVSASPAPDERYVNSKKPPPNIESPGGVKRNYFRFRGSFPGFSVLYFVFCSGPTGDSGAQRGWERVSGRKVLIMVIL